ncbi:MAG: DUF3017 domain-containing protein [Actinobacteria bacterium]|nr:MAG: DUF3017 domain-containing protein [Actinomycetota bacterium]
METTVHMFGVQRARLALQRLTIVLAFLGVCAAPLVAYVFRPVYGVWILALLLWIFALLRIVVPGRPWFAARGRAVDAFLYAGIGAAIMYFSPFTAVIGAI